MGRRVLVVGGGGREHALCRALSASSSIDEIHIAPGNAGTLHYGTNHDVAASNIEGLLALAGDHEIDFVVVGPEAPLCDGLADRLIAVNIPCFGPQRLHAELEGSKLFAKKAMDAAGVPTAEYDVMDATTDVDACLDARSHEPWVIKRDVLAGGKGVVVTSNRQEALEFIDKSIQSDGHVLLERFLPGEEASMLVVMDKSGYVCLPASQDHKRAYDGDTGPNTGGMGAYCPAPVITESIHEKVLQRIVHPMFTHLSSMHVPYRGVLYVGLMIDAKGDPYVVEFNVRFGDPECQTLLRKLNTDFLEIITSITKDELGKIKITNSRKSVVCVVLASKGYPESYNKEILIPNLKKIKDDKKTIIFHAGTKNLSLNYFSNGGRVLSVTSTGKTIEEARKSAYKVLKKLNWKDGFYRKDIGFKNF